MKSIINETVSKEQQAQNLENLKYDPSENSGNILFGNSSDSDLHFYDTLLNTRYILPQELQNFPADDKLGNIECFYRI